MVTGSLLFPLIVLLGVFQEEVLLRPSEVSENK